MAVLFSGRLHLPAESRQTTVSFVELTMCLYEKGGYRGYRDLGFFAKISVVTEPEICFSPYVSKTYG